MISTQGIVIPVICSFSVFLQIEAGSKVDTFISVYFRQQALLILENIDMLIVFLFRVGSYWSQHGSGSLQHVTLASIGGGLRDLQVGPGGSHRPKMK